MYQQTEFGLNNALAKRSVYISHSLVELQIRKDLDEDIEINQAFHLNGKNVNDISSYISDNNRKTIIFN